MRKNDKRSTDNKRQKDRQTDSQNNYSMSEKSKVMHFNLKNNEINFFIYCWILNATKRPFLSTNVR